MKTRQIYCKHYEKEARRTGVYTYKIICAEINLCQACEKKLRKKILEQNKIEKFSEDWTKMTK